MIRVPLILLLAAIVFLTSSDGFLTKAAEGKIEMSEFGKTKDGQAIYRYVLSNKSGAEAVIISYGADLVSVKVPDRNGKTADIVLGYDSIDGYEQDKSYVGATIGRYGNRIARGQFTLDGTVFHLPKNDGPNSLHGGARGFNKRLWTGVDRSRPDAFTNHSYFNLSGVATQEILNHRLLLRALEFTPVDSTLIPTGELRIVRDTPFDFTKQTAISSRINQENEQLKFGKGYDHNWVLGRTAKGGLQPAAEIFEPNSRRVLQVLTTEPGIQFYTGNFLDGTVHTVRVFNWKPSIFQIHRTIRTVRRQY